MFEHNSTIGSRHLHRESESVNIVTLAEGDITHLHIGFKGTMNALFLKDLAGRRIEVCAGAWKMASPREDFSKGLAL